MGAVTGVLGWSPESFWRASPMEVMDAIDAYNAANSGRPRAMTRERYEELKAKYPDGRRT